MSTLKHARAPWDWKDCRDFAQLVDADGEVVCDDGSAAGEYGQVIAPDSANARLIAAAPELLEALEAITALYDTDEGCRSLPEYKAAIAAIAKAKGESA